VQRCVPGNARSSLPWIEASLIGGLVVSERWARVSHLPWPLHPSSHGYLRSNAWSAAISAFFCPALVCKRRRFCVSADWTVSWMLMLGATLMRASASGRSGITRWPAACVRELE
jgi:hypothetical protein